MTMTKKTKSKLANSAPKNVRGRPSKYRAAYAAQARKLSLLGMTDRGMADFFEISESTLNLWKKEHPDFSESIRGGKVEADAHVATALFHSALGGRTVTEVKEEVDAEGNTVTKKTTRELPANVTAQQFWLKNRQPQNWRDKVVVEDETPPEQIAQTAEKFIAIMAAARERQRQVLIERGIVPSDQG